MGSLIEIISEIRLQLMLGVSLSQSLESVTSFRTDEFSQAFKIWLKRFQAGQKTENIAVALPELLKTSSRRTFIGVIEKGLKGSPVDSYLSELEQEFSQRLERAFEQKLQLLPLKLLVPLVVFILPAVVGLIIGPLFLSLMNQM